MLATHRSAEERYEVLREKARQLAQTTLPIPLLGAVTLKGIDLKTLVTAESWEGRRVNWPWKDGYSTYSFRNPKRFELAIWHRHILCGLSMGRPTWTGDKLRLDFIEALPIKNPLKGRTVEVVLSAAEAYADQIGAHQIRIMNPINDQVKAFYTSSKVGYAYDSRSDCCWRDL